ncbi:dihydrodipicolinate synthase family protein [Mesorhizobium sp. WSM4887]|uniref:dihydrodipicolinate synthase family protein n=1 Tax=Mesorhizobium sp. WSM4887 TaxID=3038543 RepID=UPI002416FC3E|nr:dihydrodipicolinate synthase family protein [Mesorhizobium sp. WSM4887]MDG4889743.1 dihydrodipicolinate synthase family protein [Mesorhizobium sp. WSM4887]
MNIGHINGKTRGVYAISPTPFEDNGEIDGASTDSLLDYYVESGVDGLTILGVLGEATKLSPEESRGFMNRVLKRIGDKRPIVVGVSNPGTDNLVRFSREAMDAGAAGVMIAPIQGLKTDDQVYNYWATVLERLGPKIPVCYQDYPQTTTVVTSVSVFNRLVGAFENLVMLKHEESPGLPKITAVRAAEDKGQRRVSILIGNGGLHLPQELRRGADGAMTGFAYPEMLVEVCRKFHAGDADGAEDVFDIYLPLLRHEQQLGFGLAIRKEVLRRRGIIKHAAMRHPSPKMTSVDHKELDELMARLERKLGK